MPASAAAPLLGFLCPPPPPLNASLLSAPRSQHKTHSKLNSAYLPHHCPLGTETRFNKQQRKQLREGELSPGKSPRPTCSPTCSPASDRSDPGLLVTALQNPCCFPGRQTRCNASFCQQNHGPEWGEPPRHGTEPSGASPELCTINPRVSGVKPTAAPPHRQARAGGYPGNCW